MRKINIIYSVLLAIVLQSFSSVAHDSVKLRVGLLSPERPPYYFVDKASGEISGFYIDLLNAVTEGLPVEFEYKVLPQARLREYMLSGQLDIEPGIDQTWRREKAEVANSVFTQPFMQSDEVLVFWDPNWQLSQHKESHACGVNGFNLNEKYFPKRTHLLTTEYQLLQMISFKRCDIAQIPELIVDYWNNTHAQQLYSGETISSYQLRLRLHKKHESMLATFNKNIDSLIQADEINTILKKHLSNKHK